MKECNGNYEAAMHYDCAACEETCEYRKNTYLTPLGLIVGACLTIVYIAIFIGILKYIGEFL